MLRLGLAFGGTAAAFTSFVGYGLLSLSPAASGRKLFSKEECDVVKALIDTYFPATHYLGKHLQGLALDAKVDAHAATLFPAEQRAVRSLLNVFNHWPRLSMQSTKTFTELPFAKRGEVLRYWESSSREERRSIVGLLRILIGMHVFEVPAVEAAFGAPFGCVLPVFGAPQPHDTGMHDADAQDADAQDADAQDADAQDADLQDADAQDADLQDADAQKETP
ncbi:MAG: hypothetical protein GY822_27355 [Deltaproteobacteria bacterium]|nr:hypothetical protein [Deltaproteobacteria bacterium]